MNTTEAKTMSRERNRTSNNARLMKPVRCRAVWLARALGAGVLMLGSIHVQADYVHLPYNKGWTDNFNNLSFSASFSPSRDIPVGTVLQSASANGKISYNVTCPVTRTVTVTGTPVPGMTDTYQTNVPGVGVHFYVTAGWSGANYISVPSTEALAASSNGPTDFYTRADLVVTGPVGNGTLTTLPSMTLNYTGTCITDSAYNSPHSQSLNAGTTIAGRTCSVTTSSVSVMLPQAYTGRLSTTGATTGATPFNLALDCSQGTKVNVTLTDASNASNTSTTLSLAPGSTATGIGLQVLNGSTPIAYGPDSAAAGNQNQWLAGTAAGGPMTIPLTAQYVRTPGTVAPGTVKGLATFTMSYQ
ncbi:fimbrial protein [Paraburkholderia sediminicola]|uniref:fimbrial protein n=1 Tax=Paraburkholderia sediminicola TaxID=458836 RepID=UPI0038BA7B3A